MLLNFTFLERVERRNFFDARRRSLSPFNLLAGTSKRRMETTFSIASLSPPRAGLERRASIFPITLIFFLPT